MANSAYLTAPLKTDRMPPGVPYIVGNEAAERFSYYGMNSILVPFMTHHLLTSLGAPDVSDDLHILSPRHDVSVRVRQRELHVKVLRHAANGLEQWAPILHARFPISFCLVGAVFAAWHRAAPVALQPSYTVEGFLEDLVGRERDLDVVSLQRARRIGQFVGCLAESSRLVIGDATMFTLAFKHEESGAVLEAVRALGLEGRENLNYVRALKRWRREHPDLTQPARRSPV